MSDDVELEPDGLERPKPPEGYVRIEPNGNGGYIVEIDGMDIGPLVNPTDLQVGFTKHCQPWVHLRLMPRTMIVDLPASVISAVQQPWIGPNDG